MRVVGNIAREVEAMPDRGGKDIAFSQYVLDQWAWFAMTGDPNPDKSYLRARGFDK